MTSKDVIAQAGAAALQAASLTEEAMLARVLHRDAMMLVIDKPPGMPVHKGPQNAQSKRSGLSDQPLDSFFPALRFGLPRPPELAHRLDRDTSGCLVLGRHRQALARLGDLFKTGAIAKTYWAVVEGDPETDVGRIDVPLIRLDPQRGWWMKAADESQSADSLPSATLWTVKGRSADRSLAWLELTPLTGRTHQLRVHCQASGWPIIGDPIYGCGPRFGGPGLHLHARAIRIPLHPNKPPVTVEAPPPAHMLAALAACGWSA